MIENMSMMYHLEEMYLTHVIIFSKISLNEISSESELLNC